jgi:hypothetical protein
MILLWNTSFHSENKAKNVKWLQHTFLLIKQIGLV